jgi:hypothetical protein
MAATNAAVGLQQYPRLQKLLRRAFPLAKQGLQPFAFLTYFFTEISFVDMMTAPANPARYGISLR